MNKSIAKDKVIFFNNVLALISSFFSQNCSKWALVVSCILGTKLCKPIRPKKDERIWQPFLNIQNHNLIVMPIPNYHSPLYFHDEHNTKVTLRKNGCMFKIYMIEGFVTGYIDGKVGTCVLLLFS
jgi:hypothetical protein